MAKLIPELNTFHPMTAGDYTERDILAQLEMGLSDDYTVFHHLHWANAWPQGDQHGELDIVVMNRADDLAALEVKAGELDISAEGMFKRYGANIKNIGYQAQRQSHKLQERKRLSQPARSSWALEIHSSTSAVAILAPVKKPRYTRSNGLSEPPGICGAFRMESSMTCTLSGESIAMTLLTTSLSTYRKHVKFKKLRARSIPNSNGLNSV